MDIQRSASPPIPPSYEASATEQANLNFTRCLKQLPRDEARVAAVKMIRYLKDEYQIGEGLGGASSVPPISVRSVSSPIKLSPINKMMEVDGNTDLIKGLNVFVDKFNNEISDFNQIVKSGDSEKIIIKADGLTRIGCNLREKVKYSSDSIYKPYSATTLKSIGLLMSTSDFSQCSKAINRLFESTLGCSATDGMTNPQNNALTLFIDKLLTQPTLDIDVFVPEIVRINNELKEGGHYYSFTASTIADFCCTLITTTLDVKVFRDSLDALFTLYGFRPFPEPLTEIPKELNNIINNYAKLNSNRDLGRH